MGYRGGIGMEMNLELKQSIINFLNGDINAFTPLYQHSQNYVYTCIYKIVNGNDNAGDAISDIMSDTYVEIYQSLNKLQNIDSFLSWAGTIASRKSLDYLKKNSKYVLLQDEDASFDGLEDSEEIIPEVVLQDREKQRLVRDIIDRELTEMQKLCIVMYYYNELKQKDIAEKLDIPESTVKTNLKRAKAKIKESVLELETTHNTKLYNIAPVLALIFAEDVMSANVPQNTTTKVFASIAAGVESGAIQAGVAKAVGAAGAAGIAGMSGTGAGIAGAGAAGATGAGIAGAGVAGASGIGVAGEVVGGATGIGVAGGVAGGAAGIGVAGGTAGTAAAGVGLFGKLAALGLKAKLAIAAASIAVVGGGGYLVYDNFIKDDTDDNDKTGAVVATLDTTEDTTETTTETEETTELTTEEIVLEDLTADELHGVELMVKYISITQGEDYASAIGSEATFSDSNIISALGAMVNELYDESEKQLALPPHYFDSDKAGAVFLKSDVEAFALNTFGTSITGYSGIDSYGMYEDGDSIVFPAVQSYHGDIITVTDWTTEDGYYIITGTKAFLQGDPMDITMETYYSDEATLTFTVKAERCDESSIGLTILSVTFGDSIGTGDGDVDNTEEATEEITEIVIPDDYVYDDMTDPMFYYGTANEGWDSTKYYDVFADNDNSSAPFEIFGDFGNSVIRQGDFYISNDGSVHSLTAYIVLKKASDNYGITGGVMIVTKVNDGHYPMWKIEPTEAGAGYIIYEIDGKSYYFMICMREIDGRIMITDTDSGEGEVPLDLYEEWNNVN